MRWLCWQTHTHTHALRPGTQWWTQWNTYSTTFIVLRLRCKRVLHLFEIHSVAFNAFTVGTARTTQTTNLRVCVCVCTSICLLFVFSTRIRGIYIYMCVHVSLCTIANACAFYCRPRQRARCGFLLPHCAALFAIKSVLQLVRAPLSRTYGHIRSHTEQKTQSITETHR